MVETPIHVRHSTGAYEIRFASLSEAVALLPARCVVITDENVRKLYGSILPTDATVLEVAPGEESKSVETWSALVRDLAGRKVQRRSTVVAFGGGVIGDLAGFVAATYMRGVPLIQIPTTILAQVDSSIGGKVGIDLPEGKNLVGSFYPPKMVLVCSEVLDTLPDRQVRNGMAEVWKYGFILDSTLVRAIEEVGSDLGPVVRRCIELKRQVVESDEFETTGERAKLNFGHTVGHAIEKVTGYGPVLHGEAIAIGMAVEAGLGEALGLTEPGTREVVEQSLRSTGLETTSLVLRNVDMLIDAMKTDKKAVGGKLAFSLLARVGECRLVEGVADEDVRRYLETA